MAGNKGWASRIHTESLWMEHVGLEQAEGSMNLDPEGASLKSAKNVPKQNDASGEL